MYRIDVLPRTRPSRTALYWRYPSLLSIITSTLHRISESFRPSTDLVFVLSRSSSRNKTSTSPSFSTPNTLVSLSYGSRSINIPAVVVQSGACSSLVEYSSKLFTNDSSSQWRQWHTCVSLVSAVKCWR